jgi:hypothetical protein
MLISTALLLDSNIRNSICTPAKLSCRRVVEGDTIRVDLKDYLVLYVLENLLWIIPDSSIISIITYQLLLLFLQPIQSQNSFLI